MQLGKIQLHMHKHHGTHIHWFAFPQQSQNTGNIARMADQMLWISDTGEERRLRPAIWLVDDRSMLSIMVDRRRWQIETIETEKQ